jgi:hypothetical protein
MVALSTVGRVLFLSSIGLHQRSGRQEASRIQTREERVIKQLKRIGMETGNLGEDEGNSRSGEKTHRDLRGRYRLFEEEAGKVYMEGQSTSR